MLLDTGCLTKSLLILLCLPTLAQMAPALSESGLSPPISPKVKDKIFFFKNFENNDLDKRSAGELLNWMVQSHQLELQKRHLFLSDGWGPGGRTLGALGSKNKEKNLQLQQKTIPLKQQKTVLASEVSNNKKTKQTNSSKSQRHTYALKWSIPGLFGQF